MSFKELTCHVAHVISFNAFTQIAAIDHVSLAVPPALGDSAMLSEEEHALANDLTCDKTRSVFTRAKYHLTIVSELIVLNPPCRPSDTSPHDMRRSLIILE